MLDWSQFPPTIGQWPEAPLQTMQDLFREEAVSWYSVCNGVSASYSFCISPVAVFHSLLRPSSTMHSLPVTFRPYVFNVFRYLYFLVIVSVLFQFDQLFGHSPSFTSHLFPIISPNSLEYFSCSFACVLGKKHIFLSRVLAFCRFVFLLSCFSCVRLALLFLSSSEFSE